MTYNPDGTTLRSVYGEFQPSPSVSPGPTPARYEMTSGPWEYQVDSAGASHAGWMGDGTWRLADNWEPADGQFASPIAQRLTLTVNGVSRDYIYYLGGNYGAPRSTRSTPTAAASAARRSSAPTGSARPGPPRPTAAAGSGPTPTATARSSRARSTGTWPPGLELGRHPPGLEPLGRLQRGDLVRQPVGADGQAPAARVRLPTGTRSTTGRSARPS